MSSDKTRITRRAALTAFGAVTAASVLSELSPLRGHAGTRPSDRLCYVQTPYVETITCRFIGDTVNLSRKMNVGFGPTTRPPLTGRAIQS